MINSLNLFRILIFHFIYLSCNSKRNHHADFRLSFPFYPTRTNRHFQFLNCIQKRCSYHFLRIIWWRSLKFNFQNYYSLHYRNNLSMAFQNSLNQLLHLLFCIHHHHIYKPDNHHHNIDGESNSVHLST